MQQRQLNLGRVKIMAPSRLLAKSLACLSLLLLVALGLALLKPTAGEEANPSLQEEASPPESDGCWVFTHLQKSGGSTIKNILSEAWGTKYFIYDSTRWKLGNEFLLSFARKFAEDHKWSVMTGGYPEALRRSPTLAENHCRWFTLFRHPISRLVSAYFYCRECPGDVACASEVLNAREVDLITFAEHWGSFGVRQFALSLVDSDEVMAYARSPEGRAKLPQVPDVDKVSGWYLLKMYLDDKVSAVGVDIPDIALYDMLEPIQEMLRSDYAAVGILEEFNTTLSLFDAALDMPGVNWQSRFLEEGRVNVDRVFKAQEAAALEQAWTDPKVREFIWLDLLLYSQAVAIFHDQVRSFGLN